MKLPGDDLIPDAGVVMDRERVFGVPAAVLWPWLVQLGKDRAGWYAPRWLEWIFIPRRKRAIRRLDDRWQRLAPGDEVPDWGPGDPTFVVMSIEAPHALVYRSVRPRRPKNGRPRDDLVFSWALVVEEIDARSCRLRLRLRTRRIGNRFPAIATGAAELVDRATVAMMFAGLRERAAASDRRGTR